MILLVNSEGPDQTAQMCKLIWAFTVPINTKTGFNMTQPKFRKDFCTNSGLYIIKVHINTFRLQKTWCSMYVFFCFFFCFLFLIWVLRPFKNISLMSSRSFIKGERKPENPGKNHLTIRKQNLAFPHVTRARLEPQRWETWWIKESALLFTRLQGPATVCMCQGHSFKSYCWGLVNLLNMDATSLLLTGISLSVWISLPPFQLFQR